MKQQITQSPFNLSDVEAEYVIKTVSGLTLEEKAAQVFVLLLLGEREQDFDIIKKVKPGGFTRYFSDDLDWEMEKMQSMFQDLPIPPLVSADLEGSRQSFSFGTQVPNQLGLSALDQPERTKQCAAILAKEGKQLGLTWSFTPVVDINAAFRSAIVGSRSYGSDVERIKRHALAHIAGLQENGMAATVKHWPGEGFDDRDQHLVTTVNPLSMETWHETFGKLYRSAFDAGVMSVMSAHIALPAYMRQQNPDIGVDAFKPASINYDITTRLLREECGFNGLVVSDATEMAGLGSWISRDQAPVEVIKAGCDVILFSLDPERDIDSVVSAVQNGVLSEQRLNEAVTRVIALKQKVGLLDGRIQPKITPNLNQPEDYKIAQEALYSSPTLVKDINQTLPINSLTHPRVLVITNGIKHPLKVGPLLFEIPDMLAKEGFDVTTYDIDGPLEWEQFDWVLYLLGDESLLTKSRIYIDWSTMMGGLGRALDRPWKDRTTIMVSFGHPYHLYDAPRVPTYINAYSTLPDVQQAVVDALVGKRVLTSTSPVDPFCGLEDAHY